MNKNLAIDNLTAIRKMLFQLNIPVQDYFKIDDMLNETVEEIEKSNEDGCIAIDFVAREVYDQNGNFHEYDKGTTKMMIQNRKDITSHSDDSCFQELYQLLTDDYTVDKRTGEIILNDIDDFIMGK
jgi:enolase